MSKLTNCRLLVETEAGSGSWNMAVDSVLLETAVNDGLATFRWYCWAEPTLSLGYFQRSAEIDAVPSLAELPRVRRITGGGAILHDQEWTYSLTIPAQQSLYRHPEELYDVAHDAIVEVLHATGYPVMRRGVSQKQSPEPVLCFSRQDAHDVICEGRKVLGSAQRRRKGAILQHGSLLLRSSPRTPEHAGLEDFRPTAGVQIAQLREVPNRLAETVLIGRLTDQELKRVQALEEAICKESFQENGGRENPAARISKTPNFKPAP